MKIRYYENNTNREWTLCLNLKGSYMTTKRRHIINHSFNLSNEHMPQHMGQFVQGGKNGRLMSFFFKVEPPCDQT